MAIQALKNVGDVMDEVIVAGIDAPAATQAGEWTSSCSRTVLP